MTKIYITFGQGHAHHVNGKTFDPNCVAVIECETKQEGRDRAFMYFDNKWHNAYFEEDFDPKIMKYFPRGLIEV